jgi:hypothetical protein
MGSLRNRSLDSTAAHPVLEHFAMTSLINFRKKAALVLGVALSMSLAALADETNLLPNGSFKNGMEGWKAAVGGEAQGSFEIVDEGPDEGDRALKVTVASAGQNFWDVFVQATDFPLIAGQTYLFRFIGRAEPDTELVLFIQSNDGGKLRTLGRQKSIVLHDGWMEYEHDFVAEEGAENALIYFGKLNHSDRTVWIANASLKKAD